MKTQIKEIVKDPAKPYDVVKVTFSQYNCKVCREKPRRIGSAYCQECADKFKNKTI